MITNVMTASLDGPRKDYIFPPVDFADYKPICDRQRSILVDLISQKASDSIEREMWLDQVEGLSSEEAENFIFALLTNTWK